VTKAAANNPIDPTKCQRCGEPMGEGDYRLISIRDPDTDHVDPPVLTPLCSKCLVELQLVAEHERQST
jgi:hypothetical protein